MQGNRKKKNSIDYGFYQHWKRQIQYAWRNVYLDFFQHKLASSLTIIVIAISITIPIIGYLTWKNVNQASHQWYPAPNLTVYLDKSLEENQITDLTKQIKNYPEVEKITYLSKNETLDEFRSWSGFVDAIDLLDENPLPAVLIVEPKEKSRETETLHSLKTNLIKLKGIDEIKIDDSWFSRLMAFTELIKTIVISISIFVIIAVSLVIGNSIRLTIFSKRKSITVMQLIGATEGFILRPFLYNGIVNGLISATLALIFSEIFILHVDSIIHQTLSIFGTVFKIEGLNWDESLLIILVTTLIGWLSAFFATKKYLKLQKRI